ncbi:MAG: adenosylcobinamide-phosphate synthase CbiB [Aestuariivirgaceae bacterium]|nr:adenosylcobinamide-phosphate synthase CbiB [Aestuariivirgaceae bacterium]
MNFPTALAALLIERAIGYPPFLFKWISHPVVWMGNWLSFLEKRLNKPDSKHGRLRGVIAWALYVSLILAITVPLTIALHRLSFGWLIEALLATTLLAQKDLHRFVAAVADGLDQSLEKGREAVSHIVGRDPKQLDESGVSRAALESLAENASDGIVAPAFWLAIGGLPALALYKAINTADSMIGHKSERYLHFGWAAARIDDLANLPAARLCGFLYAAAAITNPARGKAALKAMFRDAGKHQSPNAGWPESALAGAMDIKLGGPRSYDGEKVDLAFMGTGRETLKAQDIRDGLKLYSRAMWLLTGLAGLGALLI